VHLRRDKIAGIAADIPLLEVNDETGDAQLLLVSWGSTYAAVAAGVKRVRARGMKAAHAHLRYLNPFPANLAEVLGRYTQVLVPEINLGQLSRIIRSEFLVDAQSINKMQGVPFRVGEIEAAITVLLGGKS
jgi:2-oxoglutarate ferredoxin oxidoreductase subunit alpha